MIKWLSRDKFWELYDKHYLPYHRAMFTHGYFYSDFETLSLKTNREAITPPADEEDFAGPVLRWYAKIESHLITVTYLVGTSIVNLDFEGKLAVKEIIFSEFKALGFDPHAVNSPISEW